MIIQLHYIDKHGKGGWFLLSYYGGVRVRYLESKTIFRMGHFFFCCCGVTLASPLLIFCCLLEASLVVFLAAEVGPRIFFIFAACLSTP